MAIHLLLIGIDANWAVIQLCRAIPQQGAHPKPAPGDEAQRMIS
jgi:hypothetical protein